MTFDEYIKNPMKSSVMAGSREMYRSLYVQKYDALMVRENGDIKYKLYKSKNKYYIHIKIPSESVEEFYYDIVIEFSSKKPGTSLMQYDVRFFSNDPSFVYTFAYSFNKNKMFITELASVMSKEALTKKPDEKNPKLEIGYVKTLYFAYLFMYQRGLLTTLRYTSAEKIDFKGLASIITPADEKINERQKAVTIKEKRKKTIQKELKNTKVDKITKPMKNVLKTKTVKTVGVSKNSSKIKKRK